MSDSLADRFQLSPQQKHLWALAADGSAFNAVISLLIEGTLQVNALKNALYQVVSRHEILRTTFERQPGLKAPVQAINTTLATPWTEVDLSTFDAQQQTARVEEIFAAETQLAFDLERGPVLRSALVKLAESKHVLVLSLPSFCADAVTLSNIVSEISDAYTSRALNDEIFQYADYAAFANELLQEDADEQAVSAKQYWHDILFQAVADVQLPFQTRPAAPGKFQPKTVIIDLPANSASISDVEAFLVACWHTLLWRLTGQSTVVVGRISDGRNHEELNGAMGLFARSLPIAYEFDGSRSFASVMQDLQKLWSNASGQQDYLPLDGGAHDVPVSFLAEELPETLSANTISISPLRSHALNQRFQMQLRYIIGKATSLELRYDSQYFSRLAAERIASQFAALAKSASENPARPIADLQIMSPAERDQVLVEFNQTAADYPRDKCIHQLIEEVAARMPSQPALRFGETCLTYAQLNSRANQLAHMLRRNGVTSGTAVPLCLDRSAEMIVALLGILKAGGAYVPLVPDNPKARLAQQLSDTSSPILISEQKFLDNLPAFAGQIVCLDRDADLLASESTDNPERLNSPSDTAYVIYTSGSTGVPKGVAVSHANLVNYACFISHKLHATNPSLNFATVSTLAADLGNTAIFPALISGGCLHVIGYETAMAADQFAGYLKRHPVDVLKITPSHLASLLTAPEGEGVLPRKYLIVGGEASSWDLVSRVQQAGSCQVINHYGPTEATIGCCTFSVSENDVRAWTPATVPIGRPIANDQVYILDQRMQPVPVGVAGELCIGGAGIAKGYLNQAQQTAERFIANHFSKEPGARLYRTGDLARFLPDGNIEFLGRIDQQVKIRGFRVEPAEIESVLKKHAAVQHALVIARADKAGDKSLVAYVVARNKAPQLGAELRSYLQERLPDYMVPSAVISLDAFPLTRNGKLDTAALPSPDSVAAEHAVLAPRNPVEEGLVDIWRQVLKVERVGVEDNFFDLGGHSLLATQVISRIRSTFRVQLPLRSLFDAPTVAGLAEQIALLPQNSEDEEVARLLQELEGLSDDEAERLLSQEMQKGAEGSGND